MYSPASEAVGDIEMDDEDGEDADDNDVLDVRESRWSCMPACAIRSVTEEEEDGAVLAWSLFVSLARSTSSFLQVFVAMPEPMK